MKKFLSLVLALVMTMSLVTISAGAKEFTDDDTITYDEAVAVVSAIGVVDGYADGSFGPTAPLTRQAAAKIICNLILGPTTAAELAADTAPYKDVPVTSEFAGYIAYCQKENIISGYGDGNFKPGAPLTGYAFMKMLLGALNYDAEIEQYTGANWSINVAKRALGIGLNKGLEGTFNGTKTVNREEACLYAFNTLKADLVQYDTTITATVNGATVNVGNSMAQSQKWESTNSATRINNIKNDSYIQFAEKYFPNLVLTDDQDAFGRPANTWTWKKDEIGTYVDWALKVAEYTKKVEGGDLYNVIGATALKEYDLYAYIDGRDGGLNEVNDTHMKADAIEDCAKQVEKATYKKSEDTVLRTGDGVLTEVFVDLDNEEIYVTSINTYLAFATADYNKSKEVLSIEVNGYNFKGQDSQMAALESITKLDQDDFDVEDYEEGDALLVTIAVDEVQTIAEPETMDDCVVTQFSTKKGTKADSYTTKATIDGTSYNFNRAAWYDTEALNSFDEKLLTDKTYNFFMDPYGYVIGVEEASSELQYVFVTAVDYIHSNRINSTATASVIFPDGTMDNITVKVKDTNDNIVDSIEKLNKNEFSDADKIDVSTDTALAALKGIYKLFTPENTDAKSGAEAWNTWYSYTVKNDVYTLDLVYRQGQQTDDTNNVEINSASSKMKDTANLCALTKTPAAFGNSTSVYITVDTDTVNGVVAIDDVTSVTTGIKAVDLDVPTGVNEDKSIDETRGAYFLWDKKDYVIAAVVVGDDNASTKEFVYLLDETANWERKVDDDYFWNFDAIVEGEDSDITELDTKGWSQVKNAGYGLIQISRNADGYVIKAEDGSSAEKVVKTFADIDRGETKAVEVLKVQGNDKLAVLFEKNDTLYINDIRSGNGLVMADDVKIVTIVDGDVDDSIANLKSALASVDYDLDDDECQYKGDIVAILNDRGEAKVLILDADAPEDESADGDYIVNAWQNSNSGSVCFAIYDEDNNALTARQVRDLDLAAEDFTIKINGKKYVGESIKEYGTNQNNCGYVKVSFGDVNTVLFKGDVFITLGEEANNTIDFSFDISGINVDAKNSTANIDITVDKTAEQP